MPRFCSACGAPIGAHAPVTCAACGTQHWANAKPGAAALVVHDGRLLLTRRAIEPWRGLWCAPSGFCEAAEHPVACAEREALEEAGVRVRAVGYLGHWVDEYLPGAPDGTDPQYCAVSYYHAVPVEPPGAATGDHEVDEVAWFAPDELPAGLSPPRSGARIYGAWREAFLAGRTTTPLPDVPSDTDSPWPTTGA
jgi:ADP-ribose pyrophosphatase YjhB (NUDIX family)